MAREVEAVVVAVQALVYLLEVEPQEGVAVAEAVVEEWFT
jgi:hypothetical protein